MNYELQYYRHKRGEEGVIRIQALQNYLWLITVHYISANIV